MTLWCSDRLQFSDLKIKSSVYIFDPLIQGKAESQADTEDRQNHTDWERRRWDPILHTCTGSPQGKEMYHNHYLGSVDSSDSSVSAFKHCVV